MGGRKKIKKLENLEIALPVIAIILKI